MYVVDKLLSLQNHSEYNSVDYILSTYFLEHIHQITDLNIAKIETETSISKSSILRFCKHSGFSNLKSFLSEYYLESKEKNSLFSNMIDYTRLDINQYLHFFQDYFHTQSFQKIVSLINNAHKIVFYGPIHDISLFYQLAQSLIFKEKEVIYTDSWNSDDIIHRIKTLDENDIIFMIDSSFDFYSFSIRIELEEDNLDDFLFHQTICPLIYIGLENQGQYSETVHYIELPFSKNPLYYQYALLELSHKLMQGVITE